MGIPAARTRRVNGGTGLASEGIAARARKLAQPLAEGMGYGLVDLEYKKEGPRWVLRAYIDKRGGIDIDDCERMSHAFSDALDAADFIAQAYVLEVSSPGLDRPLVTDADFAFHEGELLDITLKPEVAANADANAEANADAKTAAKAKAKAKGKGKGQAQVVSGELVKREGGVLTLVPEGGGVPLEIPWQRVEKALRAVRFN